MVSQKESSKGSWSLRHLKRKSCTGLTWAELQHCAVERWGRAGWDSIEILWTWVHILCHPLNEMWGVCVCVQLLIVVRNAFLLFNYEIFQTQIKAWASPTSSHPIHFSTFAPSPCIPPQKLLLPVLPMTSIMFSNPIPMSWSLFYSVSQWHLTRMAWSTGLLAPRTFGYLPLFLIMPL